MNSNLYDSLLDRTGSFLPCLNMALKDRNGVRGQVDTFRGHTVLSDKFYGENVVSCSFVTGHL
jgi:hypothetical protein